MIKSPLRYPGGKSRAIKQITAHLPTNFTEFREPLVGGGSVFIYLKQTYPDLKVWINDLNPELYLFWHITQTNLPQLVAEVQHIKETQKDGKKIFLELTNIEDINKLTDLERAVRFFVLNRITFSGTIESGGFSLEAFHKRFTDSSIARLEKLADIVTPDIKITNLDYGEILQREGKDVFIFLDPPYVSNKNSKLYGKDGDLHIKFNHQKFADDLKKCPYQWLVTYDNSQEVHQNFSWAKITPWELQYGMNNYKQKTAAKGQELFISN
ncbi:DNA adenine methylase [Anabaena sp. FACHB-1237]|uniref:DNA adenine methylase n=1 Tax=Anabaena sp. FACHB-1237 TaxID=2692769 RepID=UPI001680EF35|nr:DNA adenine methylase [Anabaena sp. FACHB-1237]MBD2137508.1 DNA adenine methylase [Anabaena sp. FACHB-1237]